MSSAELNFIILKINDIDCTNLSHDETIQIFLKAEEPIAIKVQRRRAEDKNDKLYLFDDDWTYLLKYQRKPSNDINELVSVECQTDIQSCCAQHHLVTNVENEGYRPGLVDNQSIFSHYFVPGIDIEEVTLRKAQSDEKLGLTVSYSSVNDSTSLSASDDDEADSDDIMEGEEDDCDDNGRGDIYICNILPDSIAARDGRLRQGDQIIQINGKDILSKDETESLFAENKNSITLLVSRCVCTDDEFLDSAIYCDDKDQNTGMSLSLDCEPSTYSSKSSLPSFSEAQKQIPLQTITSFDTNACDHANIRAQLESVNKEISLLNSQISNMKLNKDVGQPPQSPKQALPAIINSPLLQAISFDLAAIHRSEKFTKAILSSPISQRNRTAETCPTSHSKKQQIDACDQQGQVLGQKLQPGHPGNSASNNVNVIQQPSKLVRAPEIEHIYETIPEDSDTDSYYCSPYDERKDQNRVEQWLKSQSNKTLVDIGTHCQTTPLKRIEQARTATVATEEREHHFNQSNLGRIYGNNSIFDDCENSSSAYNTGDSCVSNMLTIDQKLDDKNQSCSTLVYQPYSQQLEAYDSCNQCQLRYRKAKLTTKSCRKSLNQGDVENELTSTKCQTQQHVKNSQNKNVLNRDLTKAIKINQKLFRKAVTNTQQNVNELNDKAYIGPVSHQRSLSKNIQFCKSKGQAQLSNTFMRESTKSQSTTDETVPMVWKVKRRADGTRYIVRRPVGGPTTSSSTDNQLLQQYSQQVIGHHTTEQNQTICAAGGSVFNDEIITITESKKSSGCHHTHTTSIRNMNSWQTQQRNERTRERRYSGQQEQKQRKDKLIDTTSKKSDGNKCRQIQKQWLI